MSLGGIEYCCCNSLGAMCSISSCPSPAETVTPSPAETVTPSPAEEDWCATGCNPSFIDDTECDEACNNSDCNYDGDDCKSYEWKTGKFGDCDKSGTETREVTCEESDGETVSDDNCSTNSRPDSSSTCTYEETLSETIKFRDIMDSPASFTTLTIGAFAFTAMLL